MTHRGNQDCPEEPTLVEVCEGLITGRSANGLTVQEQIAEDTCTEHKQFCCPVCFNMGTID